MSIKIAERKETVLGRDERKKRPPVAQKEEEVVRLPGLSPQAAEGAKGNLAISVIRVNPSADKKRAHLSLNP